MADNINTATVSGNVADEPRLFGEGENVLRFKVASNYSYRKDDGEWAERADFVPVAVFGNRAKGLSGFLAKGMKVTVAGAIKTTSYERDGGAVYETYLRADKVDVASSNK